MGQLLDELRAAPQRSVGCSVCSWLTTRTTDEQAEWAEAMDDKAITNVAIFRAMSNRGYERRSDKPIEAHRKGHR